MKLLSMILCACTSLLVYILLISNEHYFFTWANINLTEVFSHLYCIFKFKSVSVFVDFLFSII
jgi:hypothetical protein